MRTDARGRRYLEVQAFTDAPLKRAFKNAKPEPCAECGKRVRHAFDRYFQRNDPDDGLEPGLAGILLGLTYDAVCGACGDRLLAEATDPASHIKRD